MKPRPVAIEFDHRFTPNLVMVFHNCSENSCSYRALSPINPEGPGGLAFQAPYYRRVVNAVIPQMISSTMKNGYLTLALLQAK